MSRGLTGCVRSQLTSKPSAAPLSPSYPFLALILHPEACSPPCLLICEVALVTSCPLARCTGYVSPWVGLNSSAKGAGHSHSSWEAVLGRFPRQSEWGEPEEEPKGSVPACPGGVLQVCPLTPLSLLAHLLNEVGIPSLCPPPQTFPSKSITNHHAFRYPSHPKWTVLVHG